MAPIYFSFLLTFFFILFFYPISYQLGLLDHPNTRKIHTPPIPLIGGITVFTSVFLVNLFYSSNTLETPFIIAIVLMITLGLIDDFIDCPAKIRFILQIILTLFLIDNYHIKIENLGNLFGFGNLYLGILSPIFSCLVMISIINAFNMIDGVDGILGVIALACFLSLALLFFQKNVAHLFIFCMTISAALIAFIMFNLNLFKMKIFMGDAGSTTIGMIIALLLIIGSQQPSPAFKPVTTLWLIAIPIMDMFSLILYRRQSKSPIMQADNNHLHHLLLKQKLTPKKVLFIYAITTLLCNITGILLDVLNVPEQINFAILVCAFGLFHKRKILTAQKLSDQAPLPQNILKAS